MKYLIVLVLTLMAIGVGCTKKSMLSGNANNLSAGNLYQPPLINGSVINMADGTILMNVNSLTGGGDLSKPAVSPATVTLDITSSTDPAGGSMSATVTADGVPVPEMSHLKFSMSFSTSGAKNITITLSDSFGLKTSMNFIIPISCDPTKFPPLSLDMSSLAISGNGAGGAGYVNVSSAGASGGSPQATYQYAIDINGDGRFDDYHTQYWNNAPSWSNMYTLYNGTRNVAITVYDTVCQFEQTFTKNVNFLPILPAIQSGQNALQEPYFYLQGNVATLSNSTDPAETVTPFDAMDSAQTPVHVLASYPLNQNNNGTYIGNFTMSGSNIYSDGNTSSSEQLLKQDMQLAFNLASDTGAVGTQTFSNVPITGLTYQTAAAPDGNYRQYTFNKDTACNANVTLIRQTAVTPCGSGSGANSTAVTILGTFSCPHLSSSLSDSPSVRSISILNGYFYVMVSASNNCVGGGQGGGGQPPPQF